MRIAILSDASGPTDIAYPGHGLGRAVAQMAALLQSRGHEIVLYAARGSKFDGHLVIAAEVGAYNNEVGLAKEAYKDHLRRPFDAMIDNGHTHMLSGLFPDVPVVNIYHDIWQPPARNAVILSEGQRALMPDWAQGAVCIPHALDADEFTFYSEAIKPEYALFMGIVREYKQPLLAIEACARLGLKLIMAGPLPPGVDQIFQTGTNVQMAGPVFGKVRTAMMQQALVFLQLGTHESFGLTTVEAGLCGVPVVGWPSGGTVDLIEYGVNGVFVPGGKDRVQAVADAIDRARDLSRAKCREHALKFTDRAQWVNRIEQVLQRTARGERW